MGFSPPLSDSPAPSLFCPAFLLCHHAINKPERGTSRCLLLSLSVDAKPCSCKKRGPKKKKKSTNTFPFLPCRESHGRRSTRIQPQPIPGKGSSLRSSSQRRRSWRGCAAWLLRDSCVAPRPQVFHITACLDNYFSPSVSTVFLLWAF